MRRDGALAASTRCDCSTSSARLAGYACTAAVVPLSAETSAEKAVSESGWLEIEDLARPTAPSAAAHGGGGGGGIAPGEWLHVLVDGLDDAALIAAELEARCGCAAFVFTKALGSGGP
jgi:hypothetical protein